MAKKERRGAVGYLLFLVFFLAVLLVMVLAGSYYLLKNGWYDNRADSPAAPTSLPTQTALPIPTLAPSATATAEPTYEPVTWKEVVAFITEDHTNWQPYEPGDYVCLNFAIDLVNNAHAKGLPAWVVGVFFKNEEIGHAFVAFKTTDRGLVYIEPQTDIPYITPQVGQHLCDLWTGQNCFGVIEEIEFLRCDADGRCVEIPAP